MHSREIFFLAECMRLLSIKLTNQVCIRRYSQFLFNVIGQKLRYYTHFGVGTNALYKSVIGIRNTQLGKYQVLRIDELTITGISKYTEPTS